MGPRPFSRGNQQQQIGSHCSVSLQWGHDLSAVETERRIVKSTTHFRCFNGATTFQPWKRQEATPRWTGRASFNGATTFQPWKHVSGRDINMGIIAASMGPRPFSRGNNSLAGFLIAVAVASMGPRPFSRGNPIFDRQSWDTPLASMGPRPFSRGNPGCLSRQRWISPLQWGHDLSAVETGRGRSRYGECHVASMGPRPFSRGNVLPHVPRIDSRRASMGPRPFSRGNQAAYDNGMNCTQLQWGHDLSAVET